MNGSVKEPNSSIYFFFPPITQWCSISDLFTGGMGVSDFGVLKYYLLNINYSVNTLNEYTYSNRLQPALQNYYNVLFGSSIRDRHV